jgi:tRNA-2-methylthio-N6-dimethylallyladenosine synthase
MRRIHVTTFGCQMNAHDSERIKGMLESLGIGEAAAPEEADVLVFNTCTIREKPDTRLAAYLGDAAARKRREPDVVVAVGGCYAEAQRDVIFERYPFVDVAFGPGSIPHLGEWIEAGGHAVPRGRFGTHETFRRDAADASGAQVQRLGPGLDGLQLEMRLLHRPRGPRTRAEQASGRDRRRARGSRAGRREGGHAAGSERQFLGSGPRAGIRTEFGELLRACDAVEGVERVRFTSPHPKDFRDPVIAAIAECRAVCEHVHLPLQSGSTRILKAMRRTYSREKYLSLVERLRSAIPDLALGTDIIVGFPGETEHDFEDTLEVIEEVGFDSAFTFVYSPRAGTEAATMPDQVLGGCEARADGASRCCRPARRGGQERGARRPARGDSGRRAEPDR